MRTALVLIMVACFAIIGALDVSQGEYRLGAISLLLALVNGLVLSA